MNTISTISINSREKENNFNEIFVSKREIHEESLAGKIFLLAEINNTSYELGRKIISFLINNLENRYYKDEKLSLKKKIESIKIEHFFEVSLANTTKDFSAFLQKEKIDLNKIELNITIGVIYHNKLLFASIGRNKHYLIHPNNENIEENQYCITDIGDNNLELNYEKTFINVVSGVLPLNSFFLLLNEASAEYLKKKKIIEIISNSKLNNASTEIKNYFRNINLEIPFLGLFIRAHEERSFYKSNEKETNSLIGDLATEDQKIQAKKQSNKDASENNNDPKIYLEKLNTTETETEKLLKKDPKLNFYKFFNITKKFNFSSYRFLKNNFSSKKIRISFLMISVISITLLIFNLFSNKKQEIITQETENLENIKNNLKQKHSQIYAHLLYNNEEGAKNILKEFKTLLDNISQNSEEEKLIYNEYLLKYNEQVEKIRHIKKAENISEISDFSDFNANAEISSIILKNNKLFAIDSKEKLIYILDLKTKLISVIANDDIDFLDLKFSHQGENDIYLFNNTNIYKIKETTKEIVKIPLKLPAEGAINSLSIFNKNFYILDKDQGKIYKYKANRTNYPINWLKAKADFASSTDFEVDGNIYVLENNGKINKYFLGSEKDFMMDSVNPEFKNAKKLSLSKKLDFIYIFDPTNYRIAVFKKNGEFIMQYYLDNSLENLADFTIDEKEEKIYILNKNKILQIQTNHLPKENLEE